MKVLALSFILLFSNIIIAETEFIDVYELTPKTLYKINKKIPISSYPPDHHNPQEASSSLRYLPVNTIIRFTGKHYYNKFNFFYTVRADVSGIGKVTGWVNPVALLAPGTISILSD